MNPPCVDVICDVSSMKPIADESFGLHSTTLRRGAIAYPRRRSMRFDRILRPAASDSHHGDAFQDPSLPKDLLEVFTPDGIELLLRQLRSWIALSKRAQKPKGVLGDGPEDRVSEEWGKSLPVVEGGGKS